MVNMLNRKIQVNDGFGVSKVATSTQDKNEDKEYGKRPKKFEDVKLQALFDEDDSQIQKQLAKQLEISHQDHMGKIQKIGRWVSHEMNDRQMVQKSSKTHVTFYSFGTKGSRFCIV